MEDGVSVNETSFATVDRPLSGPPAVAPYFRKDEPINSPGIVPDHLKRAVTTTLPLLEILQRLVYRLHPGTNLEILLAAIALYKASTPVYSYIKHVLERTLTSQVTVSEYDPVGREILAYMSANYMNNSTTTRAMLVSNISQESQDTNMRQMMLQRGGPMNMQTDGVQCMPPPGKKLFWIGWRPFMFNRIAQHKTTSPYRAADGSPVTYTITLTTPGWSLQPFQDFVKTCHEYKVQNSGETTTIFFSGGGSQVDYGAYGGGNWRSVTKAIRKLDTIDLDEDIKSDLIHDAEEYYSTESKKFYADCGIPYRRGYLFQGAPGTGKTSFSSALAGHLKCDIYMINLASGDISDAKLLGLFLTLPRKCVVVIEDIDSAGIGRELENKEAPQTPQLPQSGARGIQPPNRRRPNMVTLSGLLNAIDGNASQEGRLLIMTSNNPDALDDALTRPGRIDKKIQFGNMSASSARGIFERLIGRAALANGTLTPAELAMKAAEFARKLPANAFTPAQVQNFLQSCRGNADKAIAEVEAWAVKTKTAKLVASTEEEKTPVAPGATNGIEPTAMLNGLVNGVDVPSDFSISPPEEGLADYVDHNHSDEYCHMPTVASMMDSHLIAELEAEVDAETSAITLKIV